MNIIINGKERQVQAETVKALLVELQVNTMKIAVEHNGIIVYPESYKDTRLAEGDVIEIVTFVGGG